MSSMEYNHMSHSMNKNTAAHPRHARGTPAFVATICLATVIAANQLIYSAEGKTDDTEWEVHYRQGSIHYQNKETPKAIVEFKKALQAVFGDVAGEGPKGDEKTLRSQFDDAKTAARARYRLGLVYESQGKVEEAASLFRDAMAVVSTRGARYLGYKDGCKSCHFKEWKSWKKTKMAQAFEVLKPGAAAENKVKMEFDPQKDYTEDPNCLACHTTGYGLPGGYRIPRNLRYKARKAAEQARGGTCEVCHGPGSIYGPVHKDVDDNARPYAQEEFYAVGEYKVDKWVCTRCHNSKNPTAGPDYHFDFKEHREKDKGTHENFPLIYRIQKKSPATQNDSQSQ